MSSLEELRPSLRIGEALGATVLLARGGPDTVESLRTHARRTARRFCLDGQPLLGVSVSAALDVSVADLLGRAPFVRYAYVYIPAAAQLGEFELLPTFQRPHFTVRLQRADDDELSRLLAALGSAQVNPGYS